MATILSIVNSAFMKSQDGLDDRKSGDCNGNVPSESDSNGATARDSTAKCSSDTGQKILENGLSSLDRKSSFVKEGKLMSLQLPTGRKGFMGDIGFAFGGAVHDEAVDSEDWAAIPILIESVTRGSIAEKAGLEPGDEIIKINGVTVTNAARSVPVALIRESDKKIMMILRKGKGGRRAGSKRFSTDQLQEFSDAFSLYDRNSKGRILIRDVSHLLRMLGYNETALFLDDAINHAKSTTGEPDSDKIRWDTFLAVMRQIMKHQDIDKDAMLAYAVFDPGRQGHFNIRELRNAFLASSLSLSPLEMAEIFRKADPNLDERVTEKEFMNLLFPYIDMY